MVRDPMLLRMDPSRLRVNGMDSNQRAEKNALLLGARNANYNALVLQ